MGLSPERQNNIDDNQQQCFARLLDAGAFLPSDKERQTGIRVLRRCKQNRSSSSSLSNVAKKVVVIQTAFADAVALAVT
jgi:hypothetical protein